MTFEAFLGSLGAESPPEDAELALQALWWLKRGDWDRAHGCAQQHEGEPRCDWVHAHLHRVEGDQANAAYWYRRAGRPVPAAPIEDEWTAITLAMLGGT